MGPAAVAVNDAKGTVIMLGANPGVRVHKARKHVIYLFIVKIKYIMVGRVLFTTLALLVLLSGCGSGGGSAGGSSTTPDTNTEGNTEGPLPPPPEPTYESPDRYIDVTGDRALVFTAAGQNATIEAVVRRTNDDSEIEGATITYASSDAAAFSVTAGGTVTANTANIGSATITLSTDGAFDTAVSAAFVELTDAARFLASDQIVEHTPKSKELRLSSALDVKVDDIVVSGDRAGVMARITGVADDSEIGTILYNYEEATLDETVESMDVTVQGAPVRAVARLSEDGLTTYSLQDASSNGPSLMPMAIGGFVCETESGDDVNVNIEGSYLDFDIEFAPVVRLVRNGLTVENFDLYVDGSARFDARSGTLTIPRVSGEVTCEQEYRTLPAGRLPVFGPFNMAFTFKPSFGFEASTAAGAGSLAVTGPTLDVGLDTTAGVTYDTSGFSNVSSFQRTGSGLTWGRYEGDVDGAFEAAVEPYLKAVFNVSAAVGPRSLADFELVEVKVGGKADLSLASPIDPLVRGYTGPQWELFGTYSGSLDPLLENVQSGIQPVLNLVGIDADITSVDAELFSDEYKVSESPKPKAEASTGTTPDHTMSLVSSDAGDGTVQFVAYSANPLAATSTGSVVATANATGTHAHVRWTPSLAQRGTREIRARAYDEPFGSLGLPYAKDQGWLFDPNPVTNRAWVERTVGENAPVGDPFDNWVGLGADNIDRNVDQVRVTWHDGDQTQTQVVNKAENAAGVDAFEAEISTEFSEGGINYQEVSFEYMDGTYIDDRSVPVLVGAVFPETTDDVFEPVLTNIFVVNLGGRSEDFRFGTIVVGDPNLRLVRGRTYRFINITEPAVDFWIKYRNLPGEEHALPKHYILGREPTSRNGATSDPITFIVPDDAPNILYYRSDMQPAMNGVFYIVDGP